MVSSASSRTHDCRVTWQTTHVPSSLAGIAPEAAAERVYMPRTRHRSCWTRCGLKVTGSAGIPVSADLVQHTVCVEVGRECLQVIPHFDRRSTLRHARRSHRRFG